MYLYFDYLKNNMRNLIVLILLALPMLSLANGDKKLKAYLDSKQFYAPTIGNYIEFHLQFVGHSLNYEGADGGLIGKVGVGFKIFKNDSVIQSDMYALESPLMKDSIVEDFYDIKRFQLNPGIYTLELSLFDVLSEAEPISARQKFVIEEYNDAITISDIIVAEVAKVGDPNSNFYKSGYEIIPMISTFYPEQLTHIPAYFEVYNSGMLNTDEFGIKQSIIDANTGVEIGGFTTFSRHDTDQIVPVFKQIDITNLPTGKYQLTYTIIDKSMAELSTQVYDFERSNDIEIDYFSDEIILDPSFQASISADSVGYYLESLIPISKGTEVKNIIEIAKSKNEEKARKFIQLYWTHTAPINTYEEWMKYKGQVQLVEKLYSNNFQEGYETDRGRVYLQYGSPNDIISKEVSPTEYPYEIWIYNKIGVFSNRRFIFYNPDLVNNTYRLLHSDMVGELKNAAWPRALSIRNSTNGNVDNPNAGTQDHWGGNSDDYFRRF